MQSKWISHIYFANQLEARRDHINFNSLHGKYAKEDEKHASDVFSLGEAYTHDKFEDSHVDGEVTTSAASSQKKDKKVKKFKFPWDLKPWTD